ncbi:hypothetical protein C1H46_040214 [Malus baccata]|uniref:Cleavage inducing molecular chaperone Jiv domain-containing protein n=1 Tax=Malus baccata TaxID=106549 RepID=A0A540KJ60_MALBA|nr:hypothetical protein C1H46_040214 [Malus baccata]
MLQKIDAPSAFVCADSKIYNATEWYICQGMRCPANTHKPSFHVNTSVTSKHNTGKGTSSGQRGGRMPTLNLEENMTEEEFFEWLQNAVQTGMFENLVPAPPLRAHLPNLDLVPRAVAAPVAVLTRERNGRGNWLDARNDKKTSDVR